MAHIAKYNAAACGGMCAHYDRTPELRGFRRDNIDRERTPDNYNLAPSRDGGQVAFINRRIESLDLKRAPRKDAVRMCDCVVTMPASLDAGKRDEFFRAAFDFLADRYGRENTVSAWVHLDESSPHMHYAWVPVTKDGRLSAKDVVNRFDLKSLHADMQQHLEKALGCKVEVLLDPEKQGEKQLSHLSQSEYIAAKDEIAATKTRLEHLQREEERVVAEIREMEPASKSITESVRTLAANRRNAGREEVLATEVSDLRERVSALEKSNHRARERVAELDRGLRVLRIRHRSLRARFSKVAGQVADVIDTMREVPDTLCALTLKIASELGKRTYNPRSFERSMQRAKEAARARSNQLSERNVPSRGGWER